MYKILANLVITKHNYAVCKNKLCNLCKVMRTIYYLLLLLLIANTFTSNAKSKKNKLSKIAIQVISQIKADEVYLASDSLEGRRTGSKGEALAYAYITNRFKNIGLEPFNNKYLHPFTVQEGKKISKESTCSIDSKSCTVGEDIIPFMWSNNSDSKINMNSYVLPHANEKDNVWFVYLDSKELGKGLNNPHGDGIKKLYEKAKQCEKLGAASVLFINNISEEEDFKFTPTTELNTLRIPVLFINNTCYKNNILPNIKKDWIEINTSIEITNTERHGTNVLAYKNNNATQTVIIGAHYDHLGYGEDHNSMSTNTEKQIHNGADDNASGVATMLAVASMLQTSTLKNYNYLFVAFSGEELGLYGSKKMVEQNTDLLKQTNYMINLDMVGRLNDSSKAITIGGAGTSPSWIPYFEKNKNDFRIKYDSSGVGPSDHTSFYLKDIPVLFYFTGLHTDYHKPSDDVEKINVTGCYKIANALFALLKNFDTAPKLLFSKTRDAQQDKVASFKVTLGIMPDYTYNEGGVRVDGIIEGKIAKKYGLLAGDIITKLGNNTVSDMTTYMQALSTFKKTDATEVEIKRGKEVKKIAIIFE